eukprot:Opistho-2@94823
MGDAAATTVSALGAGRGELDLNGEHGDSNPGLNGHNGGGAKADDHRTTVTASGPLHERRPIPSLILVGPNSGSTEDLTVTEQLAEESHATIFVSSSSTDAIDQQKDPSAGVNGENGVFVVQPLKRLSLDNNQRLRSTSDASVSSVDSASNNGPIVEEDGLHRKGSSGAAWRKVKAIGKIIMTYNQKAWVQLAGHKDAFVRRHPGMLCKRASDLEKKALEALMSDDLKQYVPRYDSEVVVNGEVYIQMQDLLDDYDNPSVMDIKMGQRTFLESEVNNHELRKDLYQKMIEMDPTEPTPEEHIAGAITKLRYMQYREKQSSTSTLGFRVEGVKLANEPVMNNFKHVKTRDDVLVVVREFVNGDMALRDSFVDRLDAIRGTLEVSQFFKEHEVVGSSLLFAYDHTGQTGVWLIDFGKTNRAKRKLSHRDAWKLGNEEDGYLFGLDNLISVWKDF